MTIEIDLSKASGRNFAGKQNGRAFRELLEIDNKDMNGKETIVLKIPENAYGITSSYFVGLLGTSMLKSKTENDFKARIQLQNANDSQRNCMENAIHHVFIANKITRVF
ncbi:MAG: hypothetical protein ABNH21_05180 [Glaciecola sp.]|jgi:hypothetical protein